MKYTFLNGGIQCLDINYEDTTGLYFIFNTSFPEFWMLVSLNFYLLFLC